MDQGQKNLDPKFHCFHPDCKANLIQKNSLLFISKTVMLLKISNSRYRMHCL